MLVEEIIGNRNAEMGVGYSELVECGSDKMKMEHENSSHLILGNTLHFVRIHSVSTIQNETY